MTVASWVSCTVRDFIERGEADLKTGPFGTQLHASDYVEEGTPVINVRNIGFGDIRTEKLDFIDEETVRRLSSHLLKADDIVFGRKGAVERHVFIRPTHSNWFQGSDCLRLRFNSPSVEPRFVSYSFLTEPHKRWMVNQCSHGATMSSLNQDIVSRIPLFLPPLPTQRKIAAILSTYDDLIENNARRVAILEQMAQLLYREWFVHLRFPGHGSVRMVESELGPIPEGWEIKQLGEVIELAYGKGLPKKTRVPGPYPVFGSSGVVDHHQESLVKGPGIIVGRKGNVGTVFWSYDDFFPIDTVFYVVTDVCLHYAFYNLQEQNFISTDTAVPGLSRNQAYLLPFLLPDAQIVQEFQKLVAPVFQQVRNLQLKNDVLRRIRDLLLPRLICGELDVSALDVAPEGAGGA